MIRIGTIDEMEEYPGEKWLIVRSLKEIPENAKHVPALSPSPELFQVYKEARKKGIWDEDFFQRVYVPCFLSDLKTNQEALDLIQYLCEEGKKRNFLLACYCPRYCEHICHRSIVSGVLKGYGGAVIGPDYTKYFRLFEKIKKE